MTQHPRIFLSLCLSVSVRFLLALLSLSSSSQNNQLFESSRLIDLSSYPPILPATNATLR